VGTLGRAHSLSGELFVNLRTDSAEERFRAGSHVWVGSRPYTVKNFRLQGGRGIIRFEEVGDRTEAETLTGATLVARVDPAESVAEEGVYFDHQLVGLDVVSDSHVVGQVVRVEHLGFQDMLVVSVGGEERLVPFVTQLVPDVDLMAGQVIVHAIPGLLEDEE